MSPRDSQPGCRRSRSAARAACVQGMRPQVLWGPSLDRFPVEEIGELIESPGRDRFGFERLVPGPNRAIILSPTLQRHAQEQVVLGLDRLGLEAPGVNSERRVVAAKLDRRSGQEPQRGRVVLTRLEDLAGGLCRRVPVAAIVGAVAPRQRVGEQARPGRQQPDPAPDNDQQDRSDRDSCNPLPDRPATRSHRS